MNKQYVLGQRMMMFLAIAMLMLNFVSAFSGAGGSITSESLPGMLSYGANGTISSYGSSNAVSGQYFQGTISGRFGLNTSGSSSNSSIGSITLVTPLNNSGGYNSGINFKYDPDIIDVTSCSIYIDNILNATDNSISNGINIFQISGLSIGNHTWRIDCSNQDNTESSMERNVVVIAASNFDNETTDLTQYNISSVPNLTISKSGFGKVKFHTETDLSGVVSLDNYITISYNSIVIDSENLPQLNKSATLTLNNLSYNDITILKNGAVCTTCTISSYSSGTLIFNVTGFSNYTVVSSTYLNIYDDTDSISKYADQNITFYANYSNLTSSAPILGTCTISFDLSGWTTPISMNYNGLSGLYEYVRSFNDTITTEFNVSCVNNLGFENASTTDLFGISSDMPNTFSSITPNVTNSSRYIPISNMANISSEAGNVTFFSVNGEQTSSSWQGYYGSVSGQIKLGNSNGSILYDWSGSSISGELYAARTSNIKWYNIRCANYADLSNEDAYLGIDSTYGESLHHTFFNTTNFTTFYVSDVNINTSQNCYSTHLYNASGAQSQYFSEIVLHDDFNIVYSTIVNTQVYGFDNHTHDFEMIVGENGQNNNAITTYYFFAELG